MERATPGEIEDASCKYSVATPSRQRFGDSRGHWDGNNPRHRRNELPSENLILRVRREFAPWWQVAEMSFDLFQARVRTRA
jgi:hypothetical protein